MCRSLHTRSRTVTKFSQNVWSTRNELAPLYPREPFSPSAFQLGEKVAKPDEGAVLASPCPASVVWLRLRRAGS